MSSLSIQFFATIAEIGTLVKGWMAQDGLYGAAVEYQPFAVRPLVAEEADIQIANERVQRVIFSEQVINCRATGNNQLLDTNEGALILDVGRSGPRGLTESRISANHATKAWKKLAADFKQRTLAGMVGENDQTGAMAVYKSLRYTSGAAQLDARGTSLRPFEQSPVRLRPHSSE